MDQSKRGTARVRDRNSESRPGKDGAGIRGFLFSIINVARLYGINPENALEKTNRKFIRRFGYVEDKAKETGKNLSDMSLEEMEVYWQEAKGREQK